MSGVGSPEPPKSAGSGSAGAGAGSSGVGSPEPPKSAGSGFAGAGAGSSGVGSPEPSESAGYEILSIDELERFPTTAGTQVLRPLRRRLGFQPFGVNVWVGEHPGDHVIEPHREPDGVEELYIVLRGIARFTLGDDSFTAPAGTLVHAPPRTFREATASEAGTAVLAMGAKAGEAFKPSAWEDFYVAYASLRAGDAEQGRRAVQAALDREPDAWQGAFNAACFEALAGETDTAIEHLRRAAEQNPAEVRRLAPDDPDLDSIRTDPRYLEITK
jgi:quercetin dioxygenase-like cupin family protein